MVSVVVGDIGEKSVKLNKKYVIGTHVMWFEIEMYADFIDGMVNLLETVENKENVVLLSGDIGNRMFDGLKKSRPNQFINCGIAEASMTSIASGLALNNLQPIIYTITPFATLRCLEQIKIGAAYHEAPIIIIGRGSGLSYSELGATHHSLDDIALFRSIPGINIYTCLLYTSPSPRDS